MADPSVARALGGLGERLRTAREQADMSGLDLATALGPGWRQPKVSRIENGMQLPTADEVRAWAAATGTDAAPLLALRRKLEDNGITPANLGQLIGAKVRRQSILHEGGRQVVHVIGEAVLRTRVGKVTVETMRGQLAHLAETATLPGHELAIIPFAVPSPVAPASGFVLYDNDLAVVETLAGRLDITDPAIIARYTRWLEQLREAAITGHAAAELCRQIANNS